MNERILNCFRKVRVAKTLRSTCEALLREKKKSSFDRGHDRELSVSGFALINTSFSEVTPPQQKSPAVSSSSR